MKKTVLATHDGGKKWTRIAAAAEPSGAPERSAYTWIAFASPQYGLITGFNQPLNRWTSMFPTWLDPEDALSRRETPHLGYTLSTVDGGKTWISGSASLIGQVTRVRLRADGTGLGLIEYARFVPVSERGRTSSTGRTGKSETVFRDKRYAHHRRLGDRERHRLSGRHRDRRARCAACRPGRVRVFRSTDLKGWDEMKVDYRANAQRAIFAGAGDRSVDRHRQRHDPQTEVKQFRGTVIFSQDLQRRSACKCLKPNRHKCC